MSAVQSVVNRFETLARMMEIWLLVTWSGACLIADVVMFCVLAPVGVFPVGIDGGIITPRQETRFPPLVLDASTLFPRHLQ